MGLQAVHRLPWRRSLQESLRVPAQGTQRGQQEERAGNHAGSTRVRQEPLRLLHHRSASLLGGKLRGIAEQGC